ncbi:MAG: phosphoglycerate dehydrogenase [Pirellulales bacterium]|nr:phosphoglycerate dehydrogenase [Pirellulales bacterium]
MPPVVTITTEALFETPGPHLGVFKQAGFSVRYPKQAPPASEADTIEAVGGSQAVLAGSEPYTRKVLESLPALRVISRNGVGYDRIDLAAATDHNVAVTITPDANFEAVAEHTLALLLAVARRVPMGDRELKAGLWKRGVPFRPLRGRTLGIVGLGRIGRAVARRAAAFGMRLLGHDIAADATVAASLGVELTTCDDLLARSEFVSLHAPHTPETTCLINARSIAKMKPGAILVNTSRGGLVDEAALYEALAAGHLGGAGLDVFATEPPPASKLLAFDNVVVSPHVAALDDQAVRDMSVGAAQNIVDLYQGRMPTACLVNCAVRDTWRW